MLPSARIETTIDILNRIKDTRVPMDTVCGDFFRVRRYIGSKDRADVAERVYEMVRHHARLGWILEQYKIDDTPRARMIAYLLLQGNPQRVKDLFDGSKFGPAPLSEAELEMVRTFKAPDYPEAVAAECPPQYEQKLKALFGDDFAAEMGAMQHAATLDLRVNLFKATRAKAKTLLESDGVKTKDTSLSPWGLRCDSKAYLSKTKAFIKGWVEIQDEGSQMIAVLCDAKAGTQVLDYCAGGGGKTLALAASMQNKGRVVAMDLDSRRLEKARPRLKKAAVSDIIELRPLDDEKHRKWLKRQKETFDVVLCDVPCSGSGTWRRNPDMRWRSFGPSLDELTAIQADILEKVVHTVKPGGKLVYATCSLFREENEDQIARFLKDHPDFKLKPVGKDLGGDYMRLTPHRHGTDGFFTAVMVRD